MKLFSKTIFVALLSVLTLNVAAQDRVEFTPYTYLHLQGGVGYSVGEADYLELVSPAVSLSFGYQFSPIFGARIGVSGLQGRGGFPAIDQTYKFNYLQGAADLSVDLCNLFADFRDDRTVNPYAFAGVGYLHAFNNDEAVAISQGGQLSLDNLWHDHKGFFSGRVGAGVDFRASERVGITLEGNLNILSDKFNSKDAPNLDWQYNALVGVKIKLGRSKKVGESSQAIYVAPAPAEEEDPQPQPTPAPTPAPAPTEEPQPQSEVVAVVASAEYNIFFDFDSAKLNAEGERVACELAQYLLDNPSVELSLVGYADKQTGTPAVNLRVSQRRLVAVTTFLESKGISESRFRAEYKGDTVQPFSINEKNRVVICIAE